MSNNTPKIERTGEPASTGADNASGRCKFQLPSSYWYRCPHLIEDNNRDESFCIFHLSKPTDDDKSSMSDSDRKNVWAIEKKFEEKLWSFIERAEQSEDEFIDLRGFRFPTDLKGWRSCTKKLDFAYAVFHGEASFSPRHPHPYDIAKNPPIVFERGAGFYDTIFEKRTDFYKVKFGGEASFLGAVFKSVIFFDKVEFFKAGFRSTTFNDLVVFSDSYFAKDESEDDELREVRAKLEPGTSLIVFESFYEAIFNKEAVFRDVKFDMEARFYSATFNEPTVFKSVSCTDGITFTHAKFNHSIEFKDCHFFKKADFMGATFQAKTKFSGRCFEGLADFSLVEINKDAEVIFDKVSLSGATFQDTNVEKIYFRDVKWAKSTSRLLGWFRNQGLWDEFKPLPVETSYDFEKIAETYRQLVLSYEGRRDYDAAEEFHLGEMEMRRKSKGDNFLSRRWPKMRWIGEWLNTYNLYRIASNYGTGYWQAFFVLIILIFIFSLGFLHTGFRPVKPNDNLEARLIEYDLLPDNNHHPISTRQWLSDYKEAILFTLSVVTFQRERIYETTGWQSRLCLSLSVIFLTSQVALILLAIRRRFRR